MREEEKDISSDIFTEIYSALTYRREYCKDGEKFANAQGRDMELYALQREHKSKFAASPSSPSRIRYLPSGISMC